MPSKVQPGLSRQSFIAGVLGLGIAGCGSGNNTPFESYRVRTTSAEALFPGLQAEYNAQSFAQRPFCTGANDHTITAFLRTHAGEFLLLSLNPTSESLTKATIFPNPENPNINLYIPENPGLHPLFLLGATSDRVYVEENPNDPTRPDLTNMATRKHVGSLTRDGQLAFLGVHEIDIDRRAAFSGRNLLNLAENAMNTLELMKDSVLWYEPLASLKNIYRSTLISGNDQNNIYAYRTPGDSTCGHLTIYNANDLTEKSTITIEASKDQSTGEQYSGYASFNRDSQGNFYAGWGMVGSSLRNDRYIRRYTPDGKLASLIPAPGPEYFCVGADDNIYGGVWWVLSRPD